jgi:hypothetical protein
VTITDDELDQLLREVLHRQSDDLVLPDGLAGRCLGQVTRTWRSVALVGAAVAAVITAALLMTSGATSSSHRRVTIAVQPTASPTPTASATPTGRHAPDAHHDITGTEIVGEVINTGLTYTPRSLFVDGPNPPVPPVLPTKLYLWFTPLSVVGRPGTHLNVTAGYKDAKGHYVPSESVNASRYDIEGHQLEPGFHGLVSSGLHGPTLGWVVGRTVDHVTAGGTGASSAVHIYTWSLNPAVHLLWAPDIAGPSGTDFGAHDAHGALLFTGHSEGTPDHSPPASRPVGPYTSATRQTSLPSAGLVFRHPMSWHASTDQAPAGSTLVALRSGPTGALGAHGVLVTWAAGAQASLSEAGGISGYVNAQHMVSQTGAADAACAAIGGTRQMDLTVSPKGSAQLLTMHACLVDPDSVVLIDAMLDTVSFPAPRS